MLIPVTIVAITFFSVQASYNLNLAEATARAHESMIHMLEVRSPTPT
jgi:hypothetical protein